MAGWRDTIQHAPNGASASWRDSIQEEQEDPSQSPVTAGATGAMQGLSGGFADELGGAAKAGMNAITGVTGPLAGGNLSDVAEDYRNSRDALRTDFSQAAMANPDVATVANIAGAVASPLSQMGPTVASGKGLGASVANAAAQGGFQGGVMGAGASEEENIGGMARDAALGAGIGAGAGAGSALLSSGLQKGVEWAADRLTGAGDALGRGAEKLAVKATGATGKEAQNFAPGTGRELLDRGLVRFGDSAENVATRAGAAQQEAGESIDQILRELDAKGVTGDVNRVVKVIEDKIDGLSSTPGNEKIIKQLQGELDHLFERGQGELPISQAEVAKRNFQGQTNYASPEAEKKASAQLANAFKNEVESVAGSADPALANRFTEAKKSYGMLAPVVEAAERRTATLNQSPFGGLGDTAAAAVGLPGGPGGSVASVAARRLLSPRMASAGAVTTDYLSKLAQQAPQTLGKFAPVLQNAMQRGTQAVAATHFILQQTSEEYRQKLRDLEDPDGEDMVRVPAQGGRP